MKVADGGKYNCEECLDATANARIWKYVIFWSKNFVDELRKIQCKLFDPIFIWYGWGYGLPDVLPHLHRKIFSGCFKCWNIACFFEKSSKKMLQIDLFLGTLEMPRFWLSC